jgi:hypothetical protein
MMIGDRDRILGMSTGVDPIRYGRARLKQAAMVPEQHGAFTRYIY